MTSHGELPDEEPDGEGPEDDVIDDEDPEQLVLHAREALDNGDHAEALHLLGHALYYDPNDQDLFRLLDEIVVGFQGDVLELLPDGAVDATVHALRALLLARRGQVTEAVDRLLVQHAVDPDDPYLGWTTEWLSQPETAAALEIDPIAIRLCSIADHLPLDVDDIERERIAEFVPILELLLTHYPAHVGLSSAAACMLAKAGGLERALELAQSAVRLEPSFRTLLGLARVEGARRDTSLARTSYESAARLAHGQQEKLQARSELGALLCASGLVEEGLPLLEDVLGEDPEQEVAFAARAFTLALRDADDTRHAEVVTFAERHPDALVARDYLRRFASEWLHPPPPIEVSEPLLAETRAAVRNLANHDPDREEFGASTHRYQLMPPLPEALIAEFEREHGVAFPVDYAAFVTRVAASGAGPGYGLLPLYAPDQLELLRGEFPHKRPVRPDGTSLSPPELRTLGQPLSGVLALSHLGCEIMSVLVVRGPRAGSVWLDLRSAGMGLVPTHDSFNDWYRDWLESAAVGEWPDLPLQPGSCPTLDMLTAHLQQAAARLGVAAGALNDEQTREAFSALPNGSIGRIASGSWYFDDGDVIAPCPMCEHLYRYFVEHRMIRREQLRMGVTPRMGRR